MSDEIRQPRNVGMITPLNRTRDSGPRKKPRKPPTKPGADNRRRRPADDQSHHVDEYV